MSVRTILTGKKSQWILIIVLCGITAVILGITTVRSPQTNSSSSQETYNPEKLTQLRHQAHLPNCGHNHGHPQRIVHGPWMNIATHCVATGAPMTLGQALDHRITLVNFWAFWCAPCVRELNIFREYSQRYGHIAILLAHTDPNEVEAVSLLDHLHIQFPSIVDDHRTIMSSLQLPAGVPQSVLINDDGKIIARFPYAFHSLQQLRRTLSPFVDTMR